MPADDPAADRAARRRARVRSILVLLGGVVAVVARAARRPAPRSAWLTRLDLPDPDTPVTAVIDAEREGDVEVAQVVARDAGRAAASPRGVRGVRAGAARRRRTDSGASATPSTVARPVRRAAVEHAAAACSPAAGPTSTIQSAWRITSSSCSTTNSELPAALSRSSARSSASVSAGCRPADGSSST